MQYMKLNFHRFLKSEPIEIEIISEDKASNQIKQVSASVDELGKKAELSGKALSKSFANISLSKGFVKTRRELKDNIRNLFSDAQKMINEGNTSGKFNLKMQTEMNKFAVSDVSSDDRRKATQGEINKLLTLQKTLTTDIYNEQQKISAVEEKRLQEEQAINDAQKASSVLFNSLRASTHIVDSISNGIGSWFKHLTGVAVMFRILGGVVSRVASSIASVYETAASYQEAMNLYNTTLGKYANQANEWAERISKALYLDPKDIMQYTGALYNLVKGLGASSDAAYLMSTNLTQLSYDMSSFLNIDVQSAYEKLVSAMTGQSRAIASSGVALKQGALQEKLYSLGIDEKISKLNEASKVYLRYIQIMDSTKNMQMDLGKTIITPENALRTIKTQFALLSREIGNVFIPIVLQLVPYVMALTQVLGNLAKKLAEAFGFEIADVDYESATQGAEDMSDALDKVGSSAKSTKDSINRTLAAFDDLNVVESKSTGGSAGGSGGGVDVTDQLSKYMKNYDMLGKLTDQFKDKVDEATKNLEKFLDIIKVIGIAFGTWKLLKLIANMDDLIGHFVTGWKEGTGFAGMVHTLANGISYLWNRFIVTNSVFKSTLVNIGLLVSSLALFTISISATNALLTAWKSNNYKINSSVIALNGSITGLNIAAAALLALVNPVLSAIAFVIVAVYELYNIIKGVNDEIQTMEDEQAALRLQLVGTHDTISQVITAWDTLFAGYSGYATEVSNLDTTIKNANDSLQTAYDKFDQMQALIETGNFDLVKERFGSINSVINTMKNSTIALQDADKARTTSQIDNLLKQGAITKTEYAEMTKSVQKYYDALKTDTDKYYEKLAKYDNDLANHKISQEEYNQKVNALNEKYANVITSIDKTADGFDVYAGKMKTGIELMDMNTASADDLKNRISELGTKHDDYAKKITETYDSTHKFNQQQIDHFAGLMAQADKGSAKYKEYEKMYDMYTELDAKALEDKEKGLAKIDATYKDILTTAYQEMADANAENSDKFKEVMDDVNTKLESVGDVDISKSMTHYRNDLNSELSKVGIETKETQSKNGEKITEFLKDGMVFAITNSKNELISDGKEIGKYVTDGVVTGVKADKAKQDLITTSQNYIKNLPDAIKKELDIHSPSKVTETLGAYASEGFANGIADKNALSKLDKNTKTLTDRLKNNLAKVDVNTAVNITVTDNLNSSFNSLLSKLQTFCNKWRTAINDLMKGMKTSMNGIKVDNGKITYTQMPKVNVQKFEDGGFPTSGDLFFANENGIPEYITSIGNRSAVANQDQMVSALSGAIITAMSKIPTNSQPSNVTVYVGDKKLYEGQGEYQSRENDRYGTTVVKI